MIRRLCVLLTFMFCFVANLKGVGTRTFAQESLVQGTLSTFPQSPVKIMSSVSSFKPGESFWVAICLSLPKGWHVYWENPGDSGYPMNIDWNLPKGFQATSIHWLPPQRFSMGGLTSFGYEDEVIYLVKITPSLDAVPSNVSLSAKLSWLVCGDEGCLPEEADVQINLSYSATDSQATGDKNKIDAFIQKLPLLHTPRDLKTKEPYKGYYISSPNQLTLHIPAEYVGGQAIDEVYFFPTTQNIAHYQNQQSWEIIDKNIVVTLPTRDAAHERKDTPFSNPIEGVLDVKLKDTPQNLFYAVTLTPSEGAQGDAGNQTGFLMIIFSAVLGGIILNIMPCVFPVLSLKALSIANKKGSHTREIHQSGLFFAAGVIISFLFLANILLILRTVGQYVGWGFQMQNPYFVALMSNVLFFLGLSLAGRVYIPVLFGNKQESLAQKQNKWANFWVGVFAVLVATPCTAPFMGVAVGYALTQSIGNVLIIFFFLGLGFALPYLLLTFSPPFLKLMPKPGPWMETFKEIMSFPVFLSVVWLSWVLIQQVGSSGIIINGVSLVFITFSIWTWERIKHSRRLKSERSQWFIIGGLMLLCGSPLFFLKTVPVISQMDVSREGREEVFSLARLEELRAQKKPVLVYATAAWCITCHLNEVTLHSTASRLLYDRLKIVLMKADWTNKNPEITKFLAEFGYSGVPLYVYYPPHEKGRVLPQLLTQGNLTEAIAKE